MTTPSPAMPGYIEALRESPFLATLDRAYKTKCGEADDLEHEIILLRAEITAYRVKLTRTQNALRDARRRLELWRERHRTWQTERRELTRR